MADEDFEIDVYGDENANNDSRIEDANAHAYDANSTITIANGSNPPEQDHNDNHAEYGTQDHQGMDAQDNRSVTPHYQQGVKRKGGSDDRPVDPGATNCLLLSELHWWSTDDEIRGWVRQASCEEELKDITFSEHKVNGKSKGQAYLEFTSQQAATASKRQIDTATADSQPPGVKKYNVIYSSPTNNPFRTLPKDAPARANKEVSSRGGATAGGYNDRGAYNDRGGGTFRGRGNFNGPRGGGFNRNFSGGNMGGAGGGYNNNMMGGVGGGGSGGFNNNMGGPGNFGFNNMGGGGGNFGFRGGMMSGMGGIRGGGMRGGRGGGGMNMGGGMNPNMGGMMGGMSGMGMPMMGFQQPHFNPAFFGGGGGGGGNQQQSDWQNPHGAKRPRGE